MLAATLSRRLDGILVVDTEGRITSVNRRFVQLWSIPADDREPRGLPAMFAMSQLRNPEGSSQIRDLYDDPRRRATTSSS